MSSVLKLNMYVYVKLYKHRAVCQATDEAGVGGLLAEKVMIWMEGKEVEVELETITWGVFNT